MLYANFCISERLKFMTNTRNTLNKAYHRPRPLGRQLLF